MRKNKPNLSLGWLPEAAFCLGEIMIAVGIGMCSVPMGVIAGGVLLMVTGWLMGL